MPDAPKPQAMPLTRWLESACGGALLTALAALAAHLSVLGGGFIWLDHGDLEHGAAVAAPAGFLALFTHGFARTGFYRPLMALSLSLDMLVGSPLWFHAVNLGWHVAASVAVVFAARALGLPGRVAALAGVLFGVHPAGSLVAGALAHRSESLIGVALLLLVVAHRKEQRWLAAAALLGGALCKETVYVLAPAFIVATELVRGDWRAWRRRSGLFVVEVSALAVAAGMRLAFAPAWHAVYPPLEGSDAVGTRLAALAKSALRVLWPTDPSICDAFPILGPSHPRALAGLLVLLALGALAAWRRGPALFLFLALLPSLDLVPAPRFWSPHYLYLPLAFAAMLAAELLVRLRRGAWVGGAVLAAVLGVLSFRDGRRFCSDEAYFQPEVQAQPRCREAHFYLGMSHFRAEEVDAAGEELSLAAAQVPGYLSYVDLPSAMENLGAVRIKQRRYGEASSVLRRALEIASSEPQRRQMLHNLAASELSQGNAAEVVKLLAPEASREDANRQTLLLYVRALKDSGDREGAMTLLRRLGMIGPGGEFIQLPAP